MLSFVFLQLVLLLAAASPTAAQPPPPVSFLVDVGAAPSAHAQKLGAIIQRLIAERAPSAPVYINATALQCSDAPSNNPSVFPIVLRLSAGLGNESFSLQDCPAHGGVLIEGGDARGLLYGVGRFLHTSGYDGAATVQPSPWRGSDAPEVPGTMRAAYLATHFYNFFEAAPPSAVAAYVEDLALWGMNTVIGIVPTEQFDSFANASFQSLAAVLGATFASARAAGLEVGLIVEANMGLATRPSDIAYTEYPSRGFPDWAPWALTCAHKGSDYLRGMLATLLSFFDPLDVLLFWAYDPGGCGCTDDWPWGARGFPAISAAVLQDYRKLRPAVKGVLSTWFFDYKPAGEYDGLDSYLRSNATRGVFNAVLSDSEGGLPAWPRQHHGAPGGLPLYNFPEISMWGRTPWGGFGANPGPSRFQAQWEQTEGLVHGGAPYSEGIYNDINMVICLRHYWHGNATAAAALQEYSAFEFGQAAVPSVAAAVGLLEENFPTLRVSSSAINASAALQVVDASLPPAIRQLWRWRILILRAEIDVRLYHTGGKVECSDGAMKAAFAELAKLYFVTNGTQAFVRPPCT